MFSLFKTKKSKGSEITKKIFEALKPYLRKTYEFQSKPAKDLSLADSFTSSVYVGDRSIAKSKHTGHYLTFLYQIKHPHEDIWYRIYVDDLYSKDVNFLLSKKNGDLFTVVRYDSKPEFIIHPDIKSKAEHIIQPKDTIIDYKQVLQAPRWESIKHMPDLLKKLEAIKSDPWEDFDTIYTEHNLLWDRSHFEGYPSWNQWDEVPEGFSADDFIFELASQTSKDNGVDFGDASNVYVFEKDGEFGIVWQLT